MIPLSKLARLDDGTLLRKCMRIFDQALETLHAGLVHDAEYVGGVCRLLAARSDLASDHIRMLCAAYLMMIEGKDVPDGEAGRQRLLWTISDLSHLVHEQLGADRADWDFTIIPGGTLDGVRRRIHPRTVVLDRIRSPFNVGSLFRTADSFGVDRMLLVKATASPLHPRAQRTSMGCTGTVPWKEVEEQELSDEIAGRPVFALELGGCMIDDFAFPSDAVVIVGSEELGVSPALRAVADASLGRVAIPLYGTKGSLNVSVAFGILMHAWERSLSSADGTIRTGASTGPR
jgi:TrmH family RNA methyltransferase